MSFRHLLIKKAKHLSLSENNLLIVTQDSSPTISIPLEDISIILLEDPFSVITSRLISESAKKGILWITCDENHMPISFISPLNTHYKHFAVLRKQINVDKNHLGLIWQSLIIMKIRNQIEVIRLTSVKQSAIDILVSYLGEIGPFDNSNREGIASKVFFTSLYGNDFIRFSDNPISMALNYGYTIFSAALARHLISMGFNCNLGIWHNSEQNAYNLAHDLIEPFRPIVDYYVYWNMDRLESPLNIDIRKELVNLLNHKIIIDSKKCSVDYGMELMVKSYLKVLNEGNPQLLLTPIIIETDMMVENEVL